MKITDDQYRIIKVVCLVILTFCIAYIAYKIPRIINVLIDIAVAAAGAS